MEAGGAIGGGAGRPCLRRGGLWLGAVACHRADPPLPIPGTLWVHLKDDVRPPVTSIGGLSLGVADALRRLYGTPSLDIADPGAELPAPRTGARGTGLPSRRLVRRSEAGAAGRACPLT
jgi:hypothetical protein